MTQVQFTNTLLSLRCKLHKYALSLTCDSERANDLLQETILKALTFREKFTQDTNLKAWLYTIMRNIFINDYRRKVKTRNSFSDFNKEFQFLLSKEKSNPSPDSIYSAWEIHHKIEALEDGYRIPFTMFIEGYKYKEISEKLNLPLGTVKSRIFITRKRLGKSLQEYSNN